MDAMSVAKEFLRDRPVTATHRLTVLRAAGRVKNLEPREINAYLSRRLAQRSTLTVRTERSILLTLWRYAWENDLVETPPKGVLRFKSRKPPTVAWTPEQIALALKATERHNKRRMWSGAPKPLFLKTWLLLGYESGARMGDNFSFTADNIDGDVLRWVQSKTGDGLCKVLSPECLSCIRQMLAMSPDRTILRWVCSLRQATRVMKEHLDHCGLPGTSKWLRRSGATHIEMQMPGKASLHLGHRTIGLAASAYLDWGQIRKTTPVVPPLPVQ